MGVDNDTDIDQGRHLADPALDAALEGAGAGSYSPEGHHLPQINVYRYTNDHLLPDLVHSPDSQFDYTEWESKYMLKPTFETDIGGIFSDDALQKWDSNTNAAFTPVIDEHYLVIGHIGVTLITNIFVSGDYDRIVSDVNSAIASRNYTFSKWKELYLHQLNMYLEQGGDAFVGQPPADHEVFALRQQDVAFLVLVDPNGQVLQVLDALEKTLKDKWEIALQMAGIALDVLTIIDLAAIGIRVGFVIVMGVRSGLKFAGHKILAFILRKGAKEALKEDGRIFIRSEAEAYLAAVQNGEVIAKSSNTLLRHDVFVERAGLNWTRDAMPPMARVVTVGKLDGVITVLDSKTFYGTALPSPAWVYQAVLKVFK